MNRRFSVLALVTIAVAGLASGCDTSDRPRELSLDNVQPCDLVSRADLLQVDVIASPQAVPAIPGVDEDGTSCYYSPRSSANLILAPVTNHGIDRWTSGSMESSKAVNQPRIRGYPAVKVETEGFPAGPHDDCELYVDVASGQSLKVEASENEPRELPTCDIARQLAEDAIRSLER